jgi:hypothetical protein
MPRPYPRPLVSPYSLVQTIAKGVEIAGTTEGEKLAKALGTFEDEPLLAEPTTYTESCHVPVQRSLLIIRYEDGKPLDRRLRAAGEGSALSLLSALGLLDRARELDA